MSKNLDINNIIIIGILILIVLLVCFKCINIQNNLTENFQDPELEAANKLADETEGKNIKADEGKATQDEIDKLTPEQKEFLNKMCPSNQSVPFGSIVSKYSGKQINVTPVDKDPKDSDKSTYVIEWQPIGGKPGGCFTMEANGTYSTPLCDKKNNNQLWNIINVKDQDRYNELFEEVNNKNIGMGVPLEETKFPFYIVRSVKKIGYVLNYEGGSLSVREMANYNGQKWDAREDKIQQDPLPTQANSKFVGLNPEHNISKSDMSIRSLGRSLGSVNDNNNGTDSDETETGKKGRNGKGPVNLNINLDPDLLARLGLAVGSNGMLENLNENFNSVDMSKVGTRGGNSSGGSGGSGGSGEGNDDFLVFDSNSKNFTGGRGNVDEMLKKGSNNPSCDNCDDIPDRYIKKDLVKSMCIGCDNIDNVLT